MGFGATPAQITVTANGTQVFSGTVTTFNQPLPVLPNPDLVPDQVPLFTFETDTSFTGLIPMTCAVTNGTVIFGAARADYVAIANPVFTQEQMDLLTDQSSTWAQRMAIYTALANPPFSSADLETLNDKTASPEVKQQILKDHNVSNFVSSGTSVYNYIYAEGQADYDPRVNVTIDGVPQVINRNGMLGTWWWTIANGSTLGYDLEVPVAIM